MIPSGTLPPCSQSVGHPRRGVAIIVQILNDLLKAANNHQRAPSILPQQLPVGGTTAEGLGKVRTRPPVTRRAEGKAPGQPDVIL